MKQHTQILLLIASSFLFCSSGFSQFGKLKKVISKNSSSKNVDIDWKNQKLLPAVSLSSLLSNDGLRLELDGTLKINSLDISFLPTTDKKGNDIDYNPYKRKDMVLTADLLNSETEESMHTFYFTVSPVSRPFSLMSCIHRPRDDMHQEKKLTQGDYTLVFKVGGNEIHAFSFSIVKKVNDDAYAAVNDLYFLEGIWRDVGRLSYNEYAADKPLYFEFYILNNTTDVENAHRPNQRQEIKYSFKVFLEGKVIAASNVNSDGDIPNSIAEGRRGYWNIVGSQLVKYPAKKDRNGARVEYFTEEDLVDGAYTIVLDREHFDGTTRPVQYSFIVKGKKIAPLAEANRTEHKDWRTLIEQGPNYHFIRKSK